jgi:microcystin-dependent protein
MDAYLGQIIAVSFDWVPKGWMACDGSLLQVNDHRQLFNFIWNMYGGDGYSNFRLPDLRGRVAICQGEGRGQPNYPVGATGGAEAVQLTQSQLGLHSHTLMALPGAGDSNLPGNGALAVNGQTAVNMYSKATPDVTLASNAIAFTPNTAVPHENRQPFAVVNYIICVDGPNPPK